ncbi:hypothetical protein PVL29_012726 [Vitis rotundifolia]|uniref:Uncharacterized protein n=1 Tax=Vitis rotundifolia TaxID=103349 RepID=A0AA38ZJR3_VITRO|nr:hypothetical protein PVL29_012726 [Vitis rotundifolia]
MANCSNCSPLFDAFGVSDGKIRLALAYSMPSQGKELGLTDSLLVGSIQHSDAYIDVNDVMELKRSTQSYFMLG